MLAPIPMPYTELLPLLLEQKLVEIIPLKLVEPPYPRSYDPNTRCDYHGVAVGHATKRSLDEVEGASKREEENTVGCITYSASWMREGTHSSRLSKAESASIACIEGNDNPRPKPLIIHYNLASKPRVPFIIHVPAKPVYNSNAVTWRYPTGEIMTPPTIKDSLVPEVTNIARTGGVT
ncbi:hypothetical protein CR513_14082, partial [Mucuna pruriens]